MDDDTHAQKEKARQTLIWLWLCVLASPLAWALQLGVFYSFVGWACRHGATTPFHLATVVTFLLALAAGIASWKRVRQPDPIPARTILTDRADVAEREMPGRSFLAVCGLILSGFFMLVIVIQWLPVLVLNPCA
jgi:hypothetical protein